MIVPSRGTDRFLDLGGGCDHRAGCPFGFAACGHQVHALAFQALFFDFLENGLIHAPRDAQPSRASIQRKIGSRQAA